MLTKFIHALRRKRGVDRNTVNYQQDGAPLYCSDRSLELLCLGFPGGRLLSRRINFSWPTYSSDLNTPDYFLWGCPKERIYDSNTQAVSALKDNVRREFRHILNGMVGRVIKNLNIWVKKVQREHTIVCLGQTTKNISISIRFVKLQFLWLCWGLLKKFFQKFQFFQKFLSE